jgi:hypothetical protein
VPGTARITRDLRGVSLRVASLGGADPERVAWPREVLEALRRAGVRPSLVVL